MFIHNFKYTLKTLLKNKSLIFWTFAFPIILSLLFNLAFSNIENSEKLEAFDVAVVKTEEFEKDNIFKNTFETLSDKNNKDRLFNVQYITEENAKELLQNDKIVGYVIVKQDEYKIVTATNGINETILKYVVDEISDTSKMINKMTEIEIEKGNVDLNKIATHIKSLLDDETVSIKDISSNNLSYMLIEFYTLIAMTCLYGGVVVMEAMNQTLANMTSIGKRVGISPIKKSKIILSAILASYVIELIGVSLLMLFTTFVLKVDFGNNLPLIILLSLVGTLAGLAFGLFISVIVKANENTKVGIIIAISMALSILSGMTGVVLKYIIDKNIPIINKINPASMITDGFYSLYYYDTLDRYIMNIISLLIFSFVLIIISGIILRRQKYDSI